MVCPNLFKMTFNYRNPFAMGMTASPMIFDMLNTSSLSMQNLRCNYLFADIQARTFSAFMPSIFGGGFSLYPSNGGMFQTLTPPKNVEELARSCGIYGNGFGIGMMTPLIPGVPAGKSGGSNSDLSTEDAKLQDNIDSLKTLLRDIQESIGNVQNVEYKAIDRAINESDKKDKLKDSYDVLKNAYKELKASTIEQALKTTVSLGDEKMADVLKAAGYENEETTTDINSLYKMIDNFSNNPQLGSETVLGNLGTSYEVLDFISKWNNLPSADGNESLKYMELALQELDKLKEETDKDDFINEVIDTVANALVNKADEVHNDRYAKECLDSGTLKRISDLKDKVQGAVKDKSYDNLNDNFNELYVELRLATAKIASEKIKEQYGFLEDERLENLYIKDTEDDLEKEGLYQPASAAQGAASSGNQSSGSPAASGSSTVTALNLPSKNDKTETQGRNAWNWFHHGTKRTSREKINDNIKDLTAKTVMSYLDGFYTERDDKKKHGIKRGLIRKLDKDDIFFRKRSVRSIKMNSKLNLLSSINKSALDIYKIDEDNEDIQTIKRAITTYSDNGCEYGSVKFKRADRKALDKAIERLYNKMKEIEEEQKKSTHVNAVG